MDHGTMSQFHCLKGLPLMFPLRSPDNYANFVRKLQTFIQGTYLVRSSTSTIRVEACKYQEIWLERNNFDMLTLQIAMCHLCFLWKIVLRHKVEILMSKAALVFDLLDTFVNFGAILRSRLPLHEAWNSKLAREQESLSRGTVKTQDGT